MGNNSKSEETGALPTMGEDITGMRFSPQGQDINVVRENAEIAVDDIYNENRFIDELNEAYNDNLGNASMSPDLRNLQQEMEEYFREAVGENIPVFMGFESTSNILEQLQDGETAIQVSPDEPGFINFDVITKGID